MSGTASTIKAAWPILRRALMRRYVFRPACRIAEAAPDIVPWYDVEAPMSQGFFPTANVFRSRERSNTGPTDPVVICANPCDHRLIPALRNIPLFGPLLGYRMIAQSEGMPSVLSAHKGAHFREAIAWVGARDWCSGSVGLCGVQYLCVSQYLSAAAPEGADRGASGP